ncbi:dTDP-4-dehydrorhamnose 3,5-epimerase [Methyloceanibacter sp.]|uniref:dTDP-4-dehydrorhamnose 3,5-epimerase n=1 Tax=Methyloceanibacter sp. TaxID=1965321 RepID=UPI003D6CC2CE
MRNSSKHVNRTCQPKNRGVIVTYGIPARGTGTRSAWQETMRRRVRGKAVSPAMDITLTPLAGVLVLKPKRFRDNRGFFSETYSKRRLADAGINVDFVQDNLSVSKSPGILRGLHFQKEPFAQVKLVSVVQGAARDVVVDIRHSSPSFGRHFSIVLNAEEGNQVFVPIGFAHGFLALEPDTVLSYKVSNYYAPEHDSGIRFDDPRLGIDWGFDQASIITSDKDRLLPPFDPQTGYFP